MDKLKRDKCKVSLYISLDQEGLSEERIREGFKSIFLPGPVVGTELMRAVRDELGGEASDEDGIQYTVVLTDLVSPGPRPRHSPRYLGTVYFTEAVHVAPHIYAKDLMEIILKALGIKKSTFIYGFDPLPKRGAQVSNELVNQIREEMGF